MKIRTFLLLVLLSVITLVCFSAVIAGYRASMASAEQIFDKNLETMAHAMALIPTQASTPVPHFGSNLALQIWRDNDLLLRSDNAPESAISAEPAGFGNNNFLGQRWRTYAWDDSAGRQRIMVAQPLSRRVELAEQMAQASLSPLIVAMPLLALLIALTITHGLSPLKALSAKLRKRDADNFAPIQLNHSPAELQPVVATINNLFKKLAMAFEREKRFASDAAHELRTPLSVLQVSIHNLCEQHPAMADELENLTQGVQRMSHVVEQILRLNRTHPDHFKEKFQSVSLSALCQQVISESYQTIAERDQTIELEASQITLQGEGFALTTMLQNLIGNASKYTPDGGNILVTLTANTDCASLMIEDSGPGIAEHERARVLDRFYRIGGDQHPSGIAGCGLGMAIVSQVVDLHHGTIRLDDSSTLGGLKVVVTLPLVHPEKT